MYLNFWESTISAILFLIVAVMLTVLLKSMFNSGDVKGVLGIVVFEATALSWAGFFILVGMAAIQTTSWSINEKIMGVAIVSYVIGMISLVVADFHFNSEAKFAYHLHQNFENIIKTHGLVFDNELIYRAKQLLADEIAHYNALEKWFRYAAFFFIGLAIICSVSTSFFQ